MTNSNIYRRASFLTSAALLSQAPPDDGFEVAFVGRSNTGKSTAINVICDQNRLSRTSKTPGRTQLINFFRIDDERRLVDLPGYGYAQAPEEQQQRWQDSMTDYLTNRACLRGLVLLMDIRHPLQDYDQNMLRWCATRAMPLHIMLTKADKFNRSPALSQLREVKQQAEELVPGVGVQLFSALKHQGIEQVHLVLDTWLDVKIGTTGP